MTGSVPVFLPTSLPVSCIHSVCLSVVSVLTSSGLVLPGCVPEPSVYTLINFNHTKTPFPYWLMILISVQMCEFQILVYNKLISGWFFLDLIFIKNDLFK